MSSCADALLDQKVEFTDRVFAWLRCGMPKRFLLAMVVLAAVSIAVVALFGLFIEEEGLPQPTPVPSAPVNP